MNRRNALRKVGLLVLLLLFFGQASTLSAAAKEKTIQVQVTFVGAELVQNDHIGNEWATTATVNREELEEGDKLTLNLKNTDTITLQAVAEELDKIPDVGTASVKIKASSLSKPLTKTLHVTVTENRGRYSGNTAMWSFDFKLSKK